MTSKTDRATFTQHKRLTNLLTSVLTLCASDRTLTYEQLDAIVERARKQAERAAKKLTSNRPASVDHDLIGHLIYHWQRTPSYLDKAGKPYPIPARGPAPSIEALFKQLKIQRLFEANFSQLRKLRRIKRTRGGRFVPIADATIIHTLTPEVVEALAQTIHDLLATVHNNTSPRRRPSMKLIERAAFVPDLPKNKISQFKEFTRAQGGGLLETVNDWLERSRGLAARKPNAPGTVAAGVHVLAFVRGNRR